MVRLDMQDNISGKGEQGSPVPEGLAADARYLRRLVTGLALVMGFGVLAIVALIWARMPQMTRAGDIPPPPAPITLPEGETAAAVTYAQGRVIVVTQAGAVLFYAPDGSLQRRVD
ncbi:MAG: DUF6476 family protein [Paracoccus sp. (in: a-proteobacteria)]|uniref:DUF6476 family protein n=1 Tax=Paracoccus sp. TaxID=267 RepID=UPI0026DED91C|nr:DUF6476 family protein [Paracoccus sp. (in: a-proteobacteria)]MDO5620541.1 DUF6476 family protein [Paracoccus sp. (in: a-proteobacteria)]